MHQFQISFFSSENTISYKTLVKIKKKRHGKRTENCFLSLPLLLKLERVMSRKAREGETC